MNTLSDFIRCQPVFILAGAMFAALLAPFSFNAGASEKGVLTVPELIRDYEALEGERVTVRGIYTGEAIYGSMIPDMGDKRYGDSNVIQIKLDRRRFHRHFGRLERSVIEVTGRVRYNWICDERVPYGEKVGDTDEIVIVHFRCPMTSGVFLDSISRLKIIDTYTADDPRMSDWFTGPDNEQVAVPLPEADSQYEELSRLAGAWRRAILDRDLDQLKKLSHRAKEDEDRPLRPRNRFYNIAFRGEDSLRKQMLRNRTGPVHILIEFWEDPPDKFDLSDPDYYEVKICFCLREACGKAEIATLSRVLESNLKDPLWCFDTYREDYETWYVNLDSRPAYIPDFLTEPDVEQD